MMPDDNSDDADYRLALALGLVQDARKSTSPAARDILLAQVEELLFGDLLDRRQRKARASMADAPEAAK